VCQSPSHPPYAHVCILLVWRSFACGNCPTGHWHVPAGVGVCRSERQTVQSLGGCRLGTVVGVLFVCATLAGQAAAETHASRWGDAIFKCGLLVLCFLDWKMFGYTVVYWLYRVNWIIFGRFLCYIRFYCKLYLAFSFECIEYYW